MGLVWAEECILPCQADSSVHRRTNADNRVVPRSSFPVVLGSLGRGDADEFSVVTGEDTAVGKCRMAPDDFPPEALIRRVENVHAREFFIAGGAEMGQDQIACFAHQPCAVLMANQEGGAVTASSPGAHRGLEGFPQPLAGAEVNGGEKPCFAIAAVECAAFDVGSGVGRIDGSLWFASPQHSGGWRVS